MENLESLKINLPEDIMKAEVYGDYDLAKKLINQRIKKSIPQILKDRMLLEIIRIDRLSGSYSHNYSEALDILKNNIKDFKPEELEELKNDGYADWIYINGDVRFQNRFFPNIIKTNPAYYDRLIDNSSKNKSEIENNALDDDIDSIIKEGKKSYYIKIRAGVKIKHANNNEKVRVYIPIPKECEQIKKINILKTTYEPDYVSSADYPQRTIYFEKNARDNDIFEVEYEYINKVVYNSFENLKIESIQPDFYTEEKLPHIAFTPYLKALYAEIVGDEKNPLNIARKIYNYITQNIRYSFMRDYLAIDNIPEYAALNSKGDCGVQALLFITLLRIGKIPARWQSGLYVNPYSIGQHDWAQFYIAPLGWLFADLSFGGSAYRKGNLKRWNFYFGNIDNFRMVANSDFQIDFMPVTKYMRSDPYDNQSGEAEFESHHANDEEAENIMDIIDMHEITE